MSFSARGSEAAAYMHQAAVCNSKAGEAINTLQMSLGFLLAPLPALAICPLASPGCYPSPRRSCETTCTVGAEIAPYGWAQSCHRGGAGTCR